MAITIDWDKIKQKALPGDIILLRKEVPKGDKFHCLFEIIHLLDGDYDHAVVVVGRAANGDLEVAHATGMSRNTIGKLMLLEHYVKGAQAKGHEITQVEVRRIDPAKAKQTPDPPRIVAAAKRALAAGAGYQYGWPDLLLAGVSATRAPSPKIVGHKVDVLRAHVLALCIAMLMREIARLSGPPSLSVTCSSFVDLLHDGPNDLAGKWPKVSERLEQLGQRQTTAPDLKLVHHYDQILLAAEASGDNGVMKVLEDMCDDIDPNEDIPPVDAFSMEFFTVLGRLHEITAGALNRDPSTSPTVRNLADPERLLVGLEDLRTDDNLMLVIKQP